MLIRKIPSLKIWHLVGIVAAVAAFLAVSRFREEMFDPYSATLRAVGSADAGRRLQAVAALTLNERQAEAFAALIEATGDSDSEVRALAVRKLGNLLGHVLQAQPLGAAALGPTWNQPTRQALRRRLEDRQAQVRIEAAEVLAAVPGEGTEGVLRLLLAEVQNRDPRRSREAFRSLGVFQGADPRVQSLVLRWATNHDDQQRLQGMELLAAVWFRSETQGLPGPVLDAIEAGLADPSRSVRGTAASTAGRLAPRTRRLIPHLILALDDDGFVAKEAFWALVSFHVEAGPALPAMRQYVAKPENADNAKDLQAYIAAVEEKDHELRDRVLPQARRDLADPDPETRLAAATLLAMDGIIAPDLVPDLIRTLTDPDPRVRIASAQALGKIDPRAAADALTRAAQSDPDVAVQNAAKNALDRG